MIKDISFMRYLSASSVLRGMVDILGEKLLLYIVV
jgi:hypothetical protein